MRAAICLVKESKKTAFGKAFPSYVSGYGNEETTPPVRVKIGARALKLTGKAIKPLPAKTDKVRVESIGICLHLSKVPLIAECTMSGSRTDDRGVKAARLERPFRDSL
jgi:hypothetical protein